MIVRIRNGGKMKDLIERESARRIIDSHRTKQQMLAVLESLPPAQPEIVRCKDCIWKQGSECVRFADVRPFPDDFCSRAERREDGQNT